MQIEVKIPSPGESITQVQIASWLVGNMTHVRKDQEIAEIESDKATLPLIAPASGLISIVSEPGHPVEVGSVACLIDTTAEAPKDTHQGQDVVKETISKPVETTVVPQHSESKAVEDNQSKARLTPLAKILMEANNLSIEDIVSGLQKISRQHVEQVLELRNTPTQAETSSGRTAVSGSREQTAEPLSALRRKLSERLVASKNETAMLTTFNEVDMKPVMDIRTRYQDAFQKKHGQKVGLISFFVKAVCLALSEFKNINASLNGDQIIYHHYADVGIAVQSPKGLMVPVIRNAESLSLLQIEQKIREFAEKAAQNRISVDDLSGGTFTITNGGTFGSLLSTPIINPPQSAILGMHNIVDRPVAIEGQVVIRPMMYVALSYDHRIIDGKSSVSFLVRVKQLLENPAQMAFEGKDPVTTLLGLT